MKRNNIPPDVAAKVHFQSDRTCCVCRVKGKPVQIHHIDDDKSNNDIKNLAVLCFDCHTQTQVSGGFHRKLDAEQVILYRNDWDSLVARERNTTPVDNKTSVDIRPEKVKNALSSLRESIAQMNNYFINETYVHEFHSALDKLTSIIDISECRIPDSELTTIPDPDVIPVFSPGKPQQTRYTKEKYVKKQYLLMKIDKTLSYL